LFQERKGNKNKIGCQRKDRKDRKDRERQKKEKKKLFDIP
jgi:hypothetical protein